MQNESGKSKNNDEKAQICGIKIDDAIWTNEYDFEDNKIMIVFINSILITLSPIILIFFLLIFPLVPIFKFFDACSGWVLNKYIQILFHNKNFCGCKIQKSNV